MQQAWESPSEPELNAQELQQAALQELLPVLNKHFDSGHSGCPGYDRQLQNLLLAAFCLVSPYGKWDHSGSSS